MSDMEQLDELIGAGATMAVVMIWRWLSRACERYAQPGTWARQCTIAGLCGLGNSTVRVALKWLEMEGWISRTREMIDGEPREVIWCLWLLPSGSVDAREIDHGGAWLGGPRRPHAICPPGADGCAPNSAPKNLKWILKTTEKTTDGGNVVVFSAAPSGGAEKIPDAPPAPPPIPTPPPMPPQVQAIVSELPEADRAKAVPQIAARMPSLTASFTVEKIVEAMRRLLAAHACKSIADYGKFLNGILLNMQEDDRLAAVKAPPKSSLTNHPSAEESATAKAERRSADARDSARKRAWDGLTAVERESIEAEIRRETPPVPGQHPRFANAIVKLACLERMDERIGS